MFVPLLLYGCVQSTLITNQQSLAKRAMDDKYLSQPSQDEVRCALHQLRMLETLAGPTTLSEGQQVRLSCLEAMLGALEADTVQLHDAMQRVADKRKQVQELQHHQWIATAPLVVNPASTNIHDVPSNQVMFAPTTSCAEDSTTASSSSSSNSTADSSVNSTVAATRPDAGVGHMGSSILDESVATGSNTTAQESVLALEALCASEVGGGSPRHRLSQSPSDSGSATEPRSPVRTQGTTDSSTSLANQSAPPLLEHRLWSPPAVAVTADCYPPGSHGGGDDGVPFRHTMILHTKTVMRKPRGYEEKDKAMREQGLYCKSCLHPLKSSFSAARLGRSWDAAKFCYYTGYYYCKDCHPCVETAVIPSRVLNYWDFTPLSVCSDAKNFLELNHDTPMLCISAVNPKLYDLLSFLRAARSLRIQLNILVDIGSTCSGFRTEFFGEQQSRTVDLTTVDDMMLLHKKRAGQARDHAAGGGSSSPRVSLSRDELAHVIPAAKRYLVQDSEFWSISDLMDIKTAEDTVQQMDQAEVRRLRDALAVDAQGKLNTSATAFRNNSVTKLSSQTAGGFLRPVGGGGGSAAESAGGGGGSALTECELTTFLKQTRSNMVRHVVQLCRHGTGCCFRRAAQVCPLCKKKDFIYIFDLNRTRTCTRCGSCYHRECWQRRKGHHTACVVCVSKMVSNADQSPRSAAAAVGEAASET